MDEDRCDLNDLEEQLESVESLLEAADKDNARLRDAIWQLCDANVPIIEFCRSRGVVVGKDGIVADLLKATEQTP